MGYAKPLPLIDDDSRPFWEAARRHELLIHRCRLCGRHYFPASYCHHCDADSMEWVRASGRGKVYTFTIYHTAPHPGFKEELPYAVAYVELDEGPLFLTNIVGCRNEDIRVGMPVEVAFEDVTEEVTLPKFRPVSGEGQA